MNSKTSENRNPKSSHLQLVFLGFVSISIGIACMLDVVFIYHLPPLTSISESATTGNQAGMLLPFALGCMFTYAIAYIGYSREDQILTRIMAVGFAVVAMQICPSEYITTDRVGLLGLSQAASGIVHLIGSLTGFGAMFIWIAFFFTRGAEKPTPEKLKRNEIYLSCATLMAAGIILFILGTFGILGKYSVFIAEEFMLLPAGFALLVKGGLFFRDAAEPSARFSPSAPSAPSVRSSPSSLPFTQSPAKPLRDITPSPISSARSPANTHQDH